MADDAEGGQALAAWLVASSTLDELARTGLIPQDRAVELMDNALLALEQHAPDLGRTVLAHGYSALQGLHRRLGRYRPSGGSAPGGKPGA